MGPLRCFRTGEDNEFDGPFFGLPPGLGGAMALTASVRREEAAVGAGASGRRKKAGAPRNGEESFLAAAWQGRPWRDKEVVAMAVFMAALEVGTGRSSVLRSARCLLSI